MKLGEVFPRFLSNKFTFTRTTQKTIKISGILDKPAFIFRTKYWMEYSG
jgi:hypothetical protein